VKRQPPHRLGEDPFCLAFGKYGDYKTVRWWFFYPCNTVLWVVPWQVFVVVLFCFGPGAGPVGPGTPVALAITAIVVASLVRYVQLAVRDSKSGAPALSKQAFHWAVATTCEIFGGVIVAIIWGAVTQ